MPASALGRTGLALLILAAASAPALADTVRIGGTGMTIAVMSGIRDQMSARQTSPTIEVLPSMGTKGGLRALVDGVIEIATAGRSLKPAERALGMQEAACARTPLAFVTSHPAPNGIARADLPRIYSDPAARWADGSPLKVVMRAQSGSEPPYLASLVPGLRSAFDSAAQRQGMAIGATDQQNAQLAGRIDGSFAMMTVLQLRSERLSLRTVPLDGVEPSVETLADGSYPFSLRICLILPAQPTPGALEVVRQVRSDEGRALFRRLGAEPSD